MRLIAAIILTLIATLPAYAVDTVQIDRDGITTTAVHGSAAAQDESYFTRSGLKYDVRKYGVSTLGASVQAAIDAANAAGGGTVECVPNDVILLNTPLLLRDNVLVNLNGAVLKWNAGAQGSMVTNATTGTPLKYAGLYHGYLNGLDSGTVGATIILDLHSPRQCVFKDLKVVGSTPTTTTILHIKADVAQNDAGGGGTNAVYNTFQNISMDNSAKGIGYTPVAKYGVVLEGNNTGGFHAVTNNTFIGPFAFNVQTAGYRFLANCDSNDFIGWHSVTLATNDANGAGAIFNDTATPDTNMDVWGIHFSYLSVMTWYQVAGKKSVVLNNAGNIVIDFLNDDAPTFWGNNIVVDNYAQSYDINIAHGNPTYTQEKRTKGAITLKSGSLTLPITGSTQCLQVNTDGTVSGTGSACGSASANGDVLGPATNTADYIPLWNGANSKTLKNGYAVSSSGGTSTVLMTDSNNSLSLAGSDKSVSLMVQNNNSSTGSRWPVVGIRNFLSGNTGFPAFSLYNDGGTAGTPAATGSGITLGGMYFYGYGDNAEKQGGNFRFNTRGAFTNANQPTSFTLSLGTNGSNGSATDRIFVDHDGTMTFTGNPTFSGSGVFNATVRADKVGAGVVPSYPLEIYSVTALGSTLNNNILLAQIGGNANTNYLKSRSWIVRDTDASTGWDKTTWHDGISVDGVFGTPRTDTRVWYERDPHNETFKWGSQATTAMTLTKGGDVSAKTFTPTIPAATTYGATTTIDLSLGDSPSVTLTGNPTLAFSNPKAGQWHRLNLVQDGTGSRTVTWPSTGLVCTWRNTASNAAPTLLTGAGKVDTIVIHTLSTTSAECWNTGNK